MIEPPMTRVVQYISTQKTDDSLLTRRRRDKDSEGREIVTAGGENTIKTDECVLGSKVLENS